MSFLTLLLHFFFGANLIVAPRAELAPSSPDELQSYECAKSVAGMLEPSDQAGPVFTADKLVFAGVETNDHGRLLMINAGEGTFTVPLAHEGVNRIRFEIPARGYNQPREYFLGFLYDPLTRSRFFDMSADRPPMGKEITDYFYTKANRAEGFLPSLDYRIYETTEGLLRLLTTGRLDRRAVMARQASRCDHLARTWPAVGRNLRRNLNELEQYVLGPPSRIPASVH